MSKINVNRLSADVETLRLFREMAQQINALSEGSMAAHYSAQTAAPTSGTWNRGDKVRNSAPEELGLVGSKYVIDAWICTAGGSPGTWLQQRTPTGN